jgi:nitrate/nitrite-specific signal transduction histidine kinase
MEELRRAHDKLENRVRELTEDLENANKTLQGNWANMVESRQVNAYNHG